MSHFENYATKAQSHKDFTKKNFVLLRALEPLWQKNNKTTAYNFKWTHYPCYNPYLATIAICFSELPVKEKQARLNDGGPNVPITLLEKP